MTTQPPGSMPGTPPTKPERPLGLPIGSVRAVALLMVLATLCLIALGIAWRAIQTATDDTIMQLATLVIGAIIAIGSTAAAFYFKDRADAR